MFRIMIVGDNKASFDDEWLFGIAFLRIVLKGLKYRRDIKSSILVRDIVLFVSFKEESIVILYYIESYQID